MTPFRAAAPNSRRCRQLAQGPFQLYIAKVMVPLKFRDARAPRAPEGRGGATRNEATISEPTPVRTCAGTELPAGIDAGGHKRQLFDASIGLAGHDPRQ